eukprot:7851575-Pyramimonas_sp.AAC.1
MGGREGDLGRGSWGGPRSQTGSADTALAQAHVHTSASDKSGRRRHAGSSEVDWRMQRAISGPFADQTRSATLSPPMMTHSSASRNANDRACSISPQAGGGPPGLGPEGLARESEDERVGDVRGVDI